MIDLFDGVIGHDRVVQLLETELAVPAQAYLFVGPQSVGKATIAARFAAGLLCPTQGIHDGECRSCRLALAVTHPDLAVVEPEGATSPWSRAGSRGGVSVIDVADRVCSNSLLVTGRLDR